jgi:hypothetical protein
MIELESPTVAKVAEQFEYSVIERDSPDELVVELNRMAADGWQVASAIAGTRGNTSRVGITALMVRIRAYRITD